jgi:hypothetical protein
MRLLALASRYVLAALLVMIGLGTPIVQASDVTWNYVGAPLDQSDGQNIITLNDFLSLTVTFNGPLPANQYETNLIPYINSWTLTDSSGLVNLSSSIGSPLNQALFSTDAGGSLVGPYSFISQFSPLPTHSPAYFGIDSESAYQYEMALGINDIGTEFINTDFVGNTAADYLSIFLNCYPNCALSPNLPTIELFSQTDGSWNRELSATPLPSAAPLFATGLGGLGLLGWRRKRKAAAIVTA